VSFIAEWLSTQAQARADDLVRRGHHWVVVFEVGEASA